MDQTNEQNPNSTVATMPPVETTANANVTPQKPETGGGLLHAARKLFMFEKDPGAHPNPTPESPVANTQTTSPIEHISEWQHPSETQVNNNFPVTPETTTAPQPELSSMQAVQQESVQEPIPPLEPMQSSTPEPVSAPSAINELPSQEPILAPASQEPSVTFGPPDVTKPNPMFTANENILNPIPEPSSELSPNTELPNEAPAAIQPAELTPDSNIAEAVPVPVQEPIQTPESTPTTAVPESASFGLGIDPKEPFADITPQEPVVSSDTQAQPVSNEFPNSTFPTQSEETPISPIPNVNTLASEPTSTIPTEPQPVSTNAPIEASPNETENPTESPQTPPTQINYS